MEEVLHLDMASELRMLSNEELKLHEDLLYIDL
jgi:hypothetical protein